MKISYLPPEAEDIRKVAYPGLKSVNPMKCPIVYTSPKLFTQIAFPSDCEVERL